MIPGLKFRATFKGASSKFNKYKRATRELRDKNYDNVQVYSRNIRKILRENAPKDTQHLKKSIKTIPISRSKYKPIKQVRLEPHVPYWVFQEFGLKKPRWVVVDTKPDLIGWLERHPHVKPKKKYWDKLEKEVYMLWIGGKNTRLGKQNKFVQPARDFINKTHKYTMLLTAGLFRKRLKQISR